MARIDNLTNYLTDVSKAIKDKKGDQTAIPAKDFDTEIANLPSGEDIKDYWNTGYPTTNKNLIKLIKKIPLLNTSRIKDMSGMFLGCRYLTVIPQLNTSQANDMSDMFALCEALVALPSLDTSKVNSMQNMFQGCTALTTVFPLDLSAVTNMRYMFSGCVNLHVVSLNKAPILPDCDMNSTFFNVPVNCLIRVYDEASKDKVLASRSDLTNVVVEPYAGE